MRRVFYDEENDLLLKKKGYVIVPLLDEEEIHFLMAEHQKIEPEREEAFYTSIWHDDIEYRKKVNELIISILPLKLKNHLIDYKPVFANFMVKKARQKSTLDFHQDWTFVDESRFIALNVWVPLVDTHIQNGPLEVIEGSHLFDIPYRGRNIEGPYWHLSKYLKKYFSKSLEVPKGHAIIFDERLIHGSFDNLSKSDRIAVSNVMIPSESDMVHFFKLEKGNEIHKMQVQSDFFVRYAFQDDISDYVIPESFHYDIPTYSLMRFAKDYWMAKWKRHA